MEWSSLERSKRFLHLNGPAEVLKTTRGMVGWTLLLNAFVLDSQLGCPLPLRHPCPPLQHQQLKIYPWLMSREERVSQLVLAYAVNSQGPLLVLASW
jgi:hypothetical protein